MNSNYVIFIMGVSGVGKSTIGKLVSKSINIPFFDGDDFHPESNVIKMSQGIALSDNDRQGWLESLNTLAKEQLQKNSCIIVCSALKNEYRNILTNEIEDQSKWVFLRGTFKQIEDRINKRKNHFMSSDLLQSQFDILEEPNDAFTIDISLSPESIVKYIKNFLVKKSEFGLFGLGVMGKSLSRNLAQKGFNISLFNRHLEGIEEKVALNFKNEFRELATSQAFDSIEQFVNSLQTPRKIMLMVNSGKVIDDVIESLLLFLSEKDCIIDGGNSNYKDTKVRFDYLKSKNIYFIGAGVSGGEDGALIGPSIMPGGSFDGYTLIKPFLDAIAAKDKNNKPCCTYIGEDGSGHFVKTVHNGIEYVEMQLLAEIYTILKALGNNPDEIASILETWKTKANSYLLNITIAVLRKKEKGKWLVDLILDKAGNKGTGNWTTIAAAEFGVPATMIASALFARYTSFYKEDRVIASQNFKSNRSQIDLKLSENEILKAYQFSRIINHYQGFILISEVSKNNNWNINLSELARIWTKGCIIQSSLMENLIPVFKTTPNLLIDKNIISQLNKLKPAVKKVVSSCILNDLSISSLSESLNYLNAYATANSSANIIQAQRDYFGAHTYQKKEDKTERFYHTNWNTNI